MTMPGPGRSESRATDSDVILRIASGDRGALDQAYDLYERQVYALIVGIVRDTDEAEDVMQEVFAQIWRKASTYHSELGSAKNWILRIAHNMALNTLRSQASRSRRQQLPIEAAENTASTEPLLSEMMSVTEEVAHLNVALATLPVEQRDLITLAFIQGLSHSEIAEQTAIPLGTVKTRIRSGLMQLRSQLRHFAADHTIPGQTAAKQSTRSNSV